MTGPYGSIWFMSIYHPIGDLQKMLSRDPYRHVVGERHSQFITAGVLFGVDYLHQHEIVHGNIKPSKVLINALGYPVLVSLLIDCSCLITCPCYHNKDLKSTTTVLKHTFLKGQAFLTY